MVAESLTRLGVRAFRGRLAGEVSETMIGLNRVRGGGREQSSE
jgi:hypothetical protein